jgi:hypothetical protein
MVTLDAVNLCAIRIRLQIVFSHLYLILLLNLAVHSPYTHIILLS